MPHSRLEREALMEDATRLPPRISRGRSRLMIVAAGVLIALMLLVVVFNIEKPGPLPDDLVRFGELKELVTPEALKPGDISPNQGASRDTPPIAIEGGGWIQVTDPDGRLVQQYRFQRLDPAPVLAGATGATPGWIQMEKPNAQVYLSGNRVLTLEGATALAYRPNRVLESGTITGDVVIRLYETPAGARSVTLAPEFLQLAVRTGEARFDNVLGEIHCEDEVAVATRTGEFSGRDLHLQINDRQNRIQYLAVEHPGPIRIAASALTSMPRAKAAQSSTPPSPPQPPASMSQPGEPGSPGSPGSPGAQAPTAPGRSVESAAPPSTPAESFQPYVLTLHDNVVINQGDEATGRRSSGDLLMLLFPLQRSSAASANHTATTTAPPKPRITATHIADAATKGPAPVARELASIAPATRPMSENDPDDIAPPHDPAHDIIVTCAGRLEMVPASDAAQAAKLVSASDALLELRGDPVMLTDRADGSQATCQTFLHHVLEDRSELLGTPQAPVHLTATRFEAEGQSLWIDHRENRAGFSGAGWLSIRPETAAGPTTAPGADNQTGDHRTLVSWDRSVDLQFQQSHVTDAERTSGSGEPSRTASSVRSDLSGSKTSEPTGLKQASFSGGVEILSDELFVSADALNVGFRSSSQASNAVESIDASGSVLARSTTRHGQLSGDRVRVTLAQAGDGRTIPATMTATGNVEAADDEKTIWAESLTVAFRTDGSVSPGAQSPSPDSAAPQSWLGNAQVESVVAERNVQAAIAGGTRVFADRLVGHSDQRSLQLTGQPVLITHDQLVFERDTSVVITEQRPGYFRVEGPGKARIYPQPVQPQDPGRIPRPEFSGNPELSAAWSDWLVYDSNASDVQPGSGGTIIFHGKVDATGTPSALERDSIKTDELRLALETQTDSPAPVASRSGVKSGGGSGGGSPSLAAGNRRIRSLIADGDAELESRTWLKDDRSDKPRMFHLAGPHVEYDDRTGEALVIGESRLLIRDDRPNPVRTGQVVISEQSPFSGKGTTEFRSKQQIHMTRGAVDLFAVAFIGPVEVRHLSLDGRTATLSTDNLQASVRRPNVARDKPAVTAGEAHGSFDLGGDAELRSLSADGKVYISTPTRKVECDRFTYEYSSGVAEISARPGRRASILAVYEGAQPISIERAIWNLQTDAVNIVGASGSLNQ